MQFTWNFLIYLIIFNDNIRFTIEQHNLYVLFLDTVIKNHTYTAHARIEIRAEFSACIDFFTEWKKTVIVNVFQKFEINGALMSIAL